MANESTYRELAKKDQLAPTPWRMYLLICIVGLMIISILGYGFYTGDRMNRVYAPLIDAAMEIKLETTTAHLWFEEIISGDRHEDIDEVWRLQDQAEWYAKAMLEGGKNPEGTFVPLGDPEMRGKIKNVLIRLREFRGLTQERIETKGVSGIGTDIDQRYDQTFRRFLKEADEVETRLQQLMAKDLSRFRYTQVLLIVASILLFLAVGTSFFLFDHQRSRNLFLLYEANKRLIEAQHIAKIGYFAWDVETGEVTWSDQLFDLLQYDKTEKIDYARVNEQIHHPDDLKRVTQWLNDCIASGKAELAPNEYRLIRKDGKILYVNTVGVIERQEGKSTKVFATLQDVTERKQAEDALRESERNLSSVLNNTEDAVVRIDSNFRNIFANPALYAATGLSPEQYLGKTNEEIGLPEELCSFWHEKHENVFRNRKPEIFEFTFLTVSKGERVFQAVVAPEFDKDNVIETVVSSMRDITEIKKAEKELRESEEKFRTLFDNSPNAIALTEIKTGKLIDINAKFCQLAKVTKDETVGRTTTELGFYSKDDRNRLISDLKNSGKVDGIEMGFTVADGSTLNTRMFAIPVQIKGETFLLTEFLNITEQKRLEARLQQAHKMEFVGTLAGGIAHDYNNFLAVIMGNLSLAQEETDPHSITSELLHEVEQASLKARDLTHKFLTLSQGGHPVKNLGSIGNLLKEIPEQVQMHEVSTAFSIQNDLWSVEYDPNQIEYTIRNLLMNAVEAMPQGGCITIQAENQVIDNKDKEFPLLLNEGKYVRISIKDEGSGISEEHMDKIFDPYFSTKDRGPQKGMGMGLAVAQSVVQKHDGHILVDSKTGVGTTVTIYLPTVEEKREDQKTTQEIDHTGPSTSSDQTTIKTILVMDDEEMLRNLAQKMLQRLGYEVETVADGDEAIEAYEKQKDSVEPFDAVILDLTIKGGMGGAQTIKELIKIDPGVKAIVCSGYSNDPVIAHFKEYGFQGAISKPYQKADLEIVLKKVLG